MPTRREFLRSATAGTSLCFAPSLAFPEEKKVVGAGINDTLGAIADLLKKQESVMRVESRLVEHPTVGLVQWRWIHFCEAVGIEQFDQLEEVNAKLVSMMKLVREQKGSGLDRLMHEGLVTGRVKEQLEDMRKVHRELIEKQCKNRAVKDADLEKMTDESLNKMERLLEPTTQIFDTSRGTMRIFTMSPLARLGAGYILSTQSPLTLMDMEDPVIDRKAAEAEQSGSAYLYNKWVMTERDKHFLKLICKERGRVNHFMVGAAHDLTDDITREHENGTEKISHVVVTVDGVEQ